MPLHLVILLLGGTGKYGKRKLIGWLSKGSNLSLAFTGQEAIWQKVFRNFKMTTSDLNDFFGGPAFLAWSRMGNLHGWGGPLPQSWLDQQLILQKKFLSRMYELGMNPDGGRNNQNVQRCRNNY